MKKLEKPCNTGKNFKKIWKFLETEEGVLKKLERTFVNFLHLSVKISRKF